MAKQKDISELIRANQDQLNERPSDQLWERLEQRLDQQPAKIRRLLLRPWMAAASLAVLLAASFWLYHQVGEGADATAKAETALNDGFQLVGEIQPSDSKTIATQAIQQQQKLRAVRLNEGKRSNKLIVGKINQAPGVPAMAETAPPINQAPGEEIASLEEESTPSTLAEDAPPKEKMAADPAPMADVPASPATRATAGQEAAKKEAQVPTYQAERNAIEYHGEAMDPDVARFQWLIGQWRSESPREPSFEEWTSTDPLTIQGKGYLLINGQKTFTEQMQIKKIGTDLYFISALDPTGQAIQFKLVSYSDEQAVFENQSVDFPKQVILNQMDTNNFSTIFKNGESLQLSQDQETYFSNRNNVAPQQIGRQMERVQGN